jgi:hypothetical protein
MRERGRYQIQLMKTRSSSGVGQKIDLEFDVDSLRIRDLGEDEDDNNYNSNSTSTAGSSVLDSLKRNNTKTSSNDPSDGATVGKIKAEVGSSQLRNFINNLGDE